MQLLRKAIVLVTSCLAITSSALPRPAPTYSVVDVDGGAGGTAGALSTTPLAVPTTVYRTVPESSGAKATVSVTVIQTLNSGPTVSAAPSADVHSTQTSTSTAKPTSSTVSPASTTSFSSTVSTSTISTSTISTSTIPTSTISTSVVSTSSTISLVAPVATTTILASVPTVTATPVTITDITTYITTQPASTLTAVESSFITVLTTVSPSATPTSYYDDGMWHTSYAIKPVSTMTQSALPSSIAESPSQVVPVQTSVASPAASSASKATRRATPTGSGTRVHVRPTNASTVQSPPYPASSSTEALQPVGYKVVSWEESEQQ